MSILWLVLTAGLAATHVQGRGDAIESAAVSVALVVTVVSFPVLRALSHWRERARHAREQREAEQPPRAKARYRD